MELARLVGTSDAVGETRSRRRKVALLAGLLRDTPADELPIAVDYLAGRARQGRVPVGWRTVAAVDAPPASVPSLELGDVDETLDALRTASGPGSQAARAALLDGLFARATEAEQRWLRGLLTGEVRQGALDGLVAQALAAAWKIDESVVRRALMLSGDLAVVASGAAEGGADALRAFRLQLFRPLRPMLAQTAPDAAAAVGAHGRALVEWKLDGTRVQAHRDGGEVRLYSRSLRDVTGEFPGVVARVLALPLERAVLDGEALGIGPDGRPLPFQDTMQGRGAEGDGALRPFFFDVLHLDGEDLLDTRLEERRARLEAVTAEDQRTPSSRVDDAEQAVGALRAALAAGHEGVMVKDPASPYEAGSRGAAWLKVKPAHTLDLVVLAVEWGSGRRRGLLSNLHLGARDPDGDGFVMLGKTFKGLTDEVLAWQTERFLELAVERGRHVVRVRPEQVVEIAFDGLQRSSRYPGGLALRFARVRRYRNDKTAEDADTIGTVRAIAEGRLPPRA